MTGEWTYLGKDWNLRGLPHLGHWLIKDGAVTYSTACSHYAGPDPERLTMAMRPEHHCPDCTAALAKRWPSEILSGTLDVEILDEAGELVSKDYICFWQSEDQPEPLAGINHWFLLKNGKFSPSVTLGGQMDRPEYLEPFFDYLTKAMYKALDEFYAAFPQEKP